MTSFSDREKAFENKFAHDADILFRMTARRNKLLGLWAAAKMGKSGDDAAQYAKDVVESDFEEAGDEDVIRKVLADLTAADSGVDDAGVRAQLELHMIEARRQIIEDVT